MAPPFEGFHKQNFITAVESLSDNLEADLDQVWENLKLIYLKRNARCTQMKVMRKWSFKPRKISLQEYRNRYHYVGIQLLKELSGEGAFTEDEFNDVFYFSFLM